MQQRFVMQVTRNEPLPFSDGEIIQVTIDFALFFAIECAHNLTLERPGGGGGVK